MKMTITVKIENVDGTEEIRPIEIDAEIPEFEEFEGPHNLGKYFTNANKLY